MVLPFDINAAVVPAATPWPAAVGISRPLAKIRVLLLLLACDGLRRALAGAGVGVRALTANRQRTAVTQAAVAAEVHQALDVHRNFTTQVAFDLVVAVDRLT